MNRSLLSRYVQNLRMRRGYSLDYIAAKTKFELVEYIKFEENPESFPLCRCLEIFNFMDLTVAELNEFQLIAYHILGNPGNLTREELKNYTHSKSGLNPEKNVISLWGKRELEVADSEESSSETEC